MESTTAYALVRKFQQLQEERVHAYKIFQEGHKIYLSTAPNYNFVRFRALVQDVTQDFKQITDEIIRIECQLRCISPTLSLYVAEVQDYEKQHLELMARMQLAKQELQVNANDGTKSDILQREVLHLKKELILVEQKISEAMEAIRYEAADLV